MRPMQPRRTRSAADRAFTLIELSVVIAIIAIMAATLLPIVTQPFITERRAEAIREMAAIEEGIFGRPEIGDYGYLGTMGRMPVMTNTCGGGATQMLCELVTQGTQTGPALTNGVAIGWQGPYLRVASNQPLIDPWGQPYVLSLNPATPVGTSIQLQYQLRSNGPDMQANTADDIYFPLNGATWWNAYVESLQLDIAMASGPAFGPAPDGTKVTLTFPAGAGGMGTLGPLGVVGGAGRVTFSSAVGTRLPFGMYSLSIDVGGTGTNIVTRQVVALKRLSAAQVVVTPGASPMMHDECWIAGGAIPTNTYQTCAFPAAKAGQYLTFNLLPGQVVDATLTGGWHTPSAAQTCNAAIAFNVGDPPLGTAITSSASAPAYQPVSTTNTLPNTTLATSRTAPFATGGGINVGVLLINSGGGTCAIDGASLAVKVWTP